MITNTAKQRKNLIIKYQRPTMQSTYFKVANFSKINSFYCIELNSNILSNFVFVRNIEIAATRFLDDNHLYYECDVIDVYIWNHYTERLELIRMTHIPSCFVVIVQGFFAFISLTFLYNSLLLTTSCQLKSDY